MREKRPPLFRLGQEFSIQINGWCICVTLGSHFVFFDIFLTADSMRFDQTESDGDASADCRPIRCGWGH